MSWEKLTSRPICNCSTGYENKHIWNGVMDLPQQLLYKEPEETWK